eukprot:scaffold3935_cov51-Phaeocystis_antarctica.AAC.2
MSLRSPIRPLSPHSRGLLGAIASSVPQPPARGLRRRSELESVAATSRHRCFLARRDTARRPRVRRMAQQMSRAARCLRTACSRLRKEAAFAAEARRASILAEERKCRKNASASSASASASPMVGSARMALRSPGPMAGLRSTSSNK